VRDLPLKEWSSQRTPLLEGQNFQLEDPALDKAKGPWHPPQMPGEKAARPGRIIGPA